MSSLTPVLGLQVITPNPTGQGGLAINNNFKTLAARAAYQAASDPTTSSDNMHGFTISSKWYNTTTAVEWICTNAGTGAAVWQTVATGTVTSLAVAAPSFLTVSGSPVTTSGTITLSLANQGANAVLAAPSSASGTPSFRTLAAADIPSLTASQISNFNPAAAAAAPVQSVAGRTGTVALTSTDVGLSNLTNNLQLVASNNLSDLPNPTTARANLGLGSIATHPTTDFATITGATFTGNINAANLSGTNTGDLTIGTANGLSLSGQALSLSAIPESAVTNLTSDLAAKAPLASPSFTGTVTAGTISSSNASTSGLLFEVPGTYNTASGDMIFTVSSSVYGGFQSNFIFKYSFGGTLSNGSFTIQNSYTSTVIFKCQGNNVGFFGNAVSQQVQTTDLRTALINYGLLGSTSGATPLNLNGGAFTTSGTATMGALTVTGIAKFSGNNLNLNTGTGTGGGTVYMDGGKISTLNSIVDSTGTALLDGVNRRLYGPSGNTFLDWASHVLYMRGGTINLNDSSGSGGGTINLEGGQIVKMRADNQSSAPSSPNLGQVYFDTTANHFYGWNGTAWKQLDN